MSGFPWTDRALTMLRQMWDDGAAASAIAAELGTTKNSVLGKAHRLRLPARANPVPRPPGGWVKPPPKPDRVGIKRPAGHAAVRDTFEALGLTIYRARVPPSAALPIPRGSIGPARTCQWTDSNRAPWEWCGAPSLDGYSWCAAHKRVVFPPREARDVVT